MGVVFEGKFGLALIIKEFEFTVVPPLVKKFMDG
jgi:hypothetical protein